LFLHPKKEKERKGNPMSFRRFFLGWPKRPEKSL
jgi:hypothetical protein